MKYLYIIIGLLVMQPILFTFAVSSQEITATAPAPSHYASILPFPAQLHCDEITSPYLGPAWNEIQLGIASTQDLQDVIFAIHPEYSGGFNAESQFAEFGLSRSVAEDFSVPSTIRACFDSETEIITAIQLNISSGALFLDDLVALYDIPDIVTWATSTNLRLAFWFGNGIAVEIWVDESELFAEYGEIQSLTYFPFQPVEEFETRWPFNRTVSGELLEQLERRATLTPEVPNIANPFDFDAMIATITAEPSRTPTSTFMPRPTATPIPSTTAAATASSRR